MDMSTLSTPHLDLETGMIFSILHLAQVQEVLNIYAGLRILINNFCLALSHYIDPSQIYFEFDQEGNKKKGSTR